MKVNEEPKPDRRRSKYTRCEKTILVRIHATMVPHDSPEFIERAKMGRPPGSPPIPNYLRAEPKPDDGPPTTT